jgi:uncharacterized protein (DUF488 family)
MAVNIFTIGFTKKSAERFFTLLEHSGARTLVDVRLNNVSQLAGFAKRDDLRFFLRRIGAMDYVHRPDLAPTQDMLDRYKKRNEIPWSVYEFEFLSLMSARRIESSVPQDLLQDAVLLCSEDKPHHCHRRLVAEYLAEHWCDVTVSHLT